jgi:branched-chain amino acid transport system ATP-binding protein
MSDAPLLKIHGLEAFYGDSQALYGVDLEIRAGQIIAIIGANGAGKSTLLNSIAGLVAVKPEGIALAGQPIGGEPPYTIVARGIALVPEGRRLFASLSVEENLIIGAQVARPGVWTLERVYQLFPVLAERRDYPATQLSGGQQQMVAIGRALMARPALVLLDEPSMGLAPQVVEEIFETIATLNRDDGVSFLLAEQNAAIALRYAQYGYVLESGRVVKHGQAQTLLDLDTLRDAYLGSDKPGKSGAAATPGRSRRLRAQLAPPGLP